MRRLRPSPFVALAAVLFAAAPGASAQEPEPAPLPPGYGPSPSQSPAPPPPPPPRPCCRASFRFDPFQLIFRRLAFEAEVKVFGPFSVGVEPAWIWGGNANNLDQQGFQLLGYVGWAFSGSPMRGFWLRAVGGFETFDATLTHSKFADVHVKKNVGSGIFGVMIGDSVVLFGENSGVALSGGIGVGVATANKTQLIAESPDPNVASEIVSYYDGGDRVKLLGSLGLGFTF